MTDERKEILSRVNGLIHKRKEELLKKLPNIHQIDDGIVIRFFTAWDSCDENTGIKYKKIINDDKPEEKIVFFYLPKGAYFMLKKRDYIGCLTCLSGKLELEFDNKLRILDRYHKICLDSDVFEGHALENTYVVTTNQL
jgi:hypothetical protein